MVIRENVNHHREIKTELHALGYDYAWQHKQWCVWRDSRFIADFSPNLYQEDRPVQDPSAPSTGKGGPCRRAATLNDFMEVARRSKAKPARPLHLKRSGQSSNVEPAHGRAPSRQGPCANSSSSVGPSLAAPQHGKVAGACGRVPRVPCNLRVAREWATQQNAAVDGAVLIAREEEAHRDHGMAIQASAVVAISAALNGRSRAASGGCP